MSAAYAKTTFPDEMFSSAREKMETMVAELQSPKMLAAEHSELEAFVRRRGASCNGYCTRPTSIFARRASVRCPCAAVTAWSAPTGVRAAPARHDPGRVMVPRLAYQAPGSEDLHPMDATLNLPRELFSHGIRRLVAKEVARASFDEVVEMVRRLVRCPDRQAAGRGARRARRAGLRGVLRAARARAGGRSRPDGAQHRRQGDRDAARGPAGGDAPRGGEEGQQARDAARARGEEQPQAHGAGRGGVLGGAVAAHGGRRARQAATRGATTPTPRPKSARQAGVGERGEAPAQGHPRHVRRGAEARPGATPPLGGARRRRAQAARGGEGRGAPRRREVTILVDVVHVLEYVWKAARALFGESTPEAEGWVGIGSSPCSPGAAADRSRRRFVWWARRSGSSMRRLAHDREGVRLPRRPHAHAPHALRRGARATASRSRRASSRARAATW